MIKIFCLKHSWSLLEVIFELVESISQSCGIKSVFDHLKVALLEKLSLDKSVQVAEVRVLKITIQNRFRPFSIERKSNQCLPTFHVSETRKDNLVTVSAG